MGRLTGNLGHRDSLEREAMVPTVAFPGGRGLSCTRFGDRIRDSNRITHFNKQNIQKVFVLHAHLPDVSIDHRDRQRDAVV